MVRPGRVLEVVDLPHLVFALDVKLSVNVIRKNLLDDILDQNFSKSSLYLRFRPILFRLGLTFFDQFGQHYDVFHIFLPNHPPKVGES